MSNSLKICGRILSFLPAIFILAVSWYLSSQPTISHMPSFWSADKLVHIICYGGLAGAVSFWPGAKRWFNHYWQCFIFCIAFVMLYGIIDELHQSFTPGRDCSILDLCADLIGALGGTAVGSFLIRKLYRNKV